MGKYVIACDDDEGIVEIIKIVLQERGIDIKVTTNSEEVYSLIDEHKPDLILLDLWMPRIRGEEIARKLKLGEKTKDIPIVIISASRDTERIAKDVGANTFLSKPFDLEDLEEVVDTYLQ